MFRLPFAVSTELFCRVGDSDNATWYISLSKKISPRCIENTTHIPTHGILTDINSLQSHDGVPPRFSSHFVTLWILYDFVECDI